MLAELMRPELVVGSALIHPVLVHPFQKIVAAEFLYERTDLSTGPGWNRRTSRRPRGCVRRRTRIILPIQIAVLRVAPIAEIRPEAMQGPGVGREELALGFEAGVGGPKLSGEEETAECFGAAGVDREGVGGWAGEDGLLENAGVVERGGVGVERSEGGGEEGGDGQKMASHVKRKWCVISMRWQVQETTIYHRLTFRFLILELSLISPHLSYSSVASANDHERRPAPSRNVSMPGS